MPLLDHFHPPLLNRLPSWESFHSFWAVAIAEHLNQLLPRRYIATVTTHLGSEVEADVAEFESPFEPEVGLTSVGGTRFGGNGEIGVPITPSNSDCFVAKFDCL